ncbi:MAG: acyltransferase [Smithellaceae bacterium]|nr:acyltransferase [Syntrophaceae bacterium]MDD4240907.1 acyltransferase [Smithellaceae bacterium]NLX53271.1 acyltransferase [Deltaproteobacteria bacterium]
MIHDHRPYYLKRLSHAFEQWYANHFLAPQCEHFGRHLVFMKPWGVEIYGSPVSIGDYTTLIATMDRRIRLTSWIANGKSGKVEIGRHCLICPGTRIQAATAITIGDDCMMAQNVCITDADWHDLYDRSVAIGQTREVVIANNVWIGDSAMVCKGVHIGENAVIGAGSIVVKDIPANAIAAGNPAGVVRYLDPTRPVRSRSQWMSDPKKMNEYFDAVERIMREKNSLFGWIRSILFPRKGD